MAQQSNDLFVNLRVSPLKGTLYLFLQTKGTDNQLRRPIPGLEGLNLNLKKWTREKDDSHPYGKFNDPSIDAIAANTAIRTYVDGFRLVNETFKPATCQELYRLYECSTKMMADGSRTVKKETLGDFLIKMIGQQKDCTGFHFGLPSSTYQQYLNLLRKLELEGELINVPIEDIDTAHCKQFSNFIIGDLDGVNYRNLIKYFKAVHNRAVEQGKNNHPIVFSGVKGAKNAKKKTDERREGIRALTKKQLEAFEQYDLSQLLGHFTPKKALESYEIYRDFAVFMYELKLRPIDTVKMKYENIFVDEEGVDFIEYVPEKKKNCVDCNGDPVPPVQCPMTDKAVEIALKYRGRSSQGYIFPFALNEYVWDYSDPVQYRKHYRKWNTLLEQINTFLHLLEEPLNFPGLTLYMFRHTAFTIACKEMKESVLEIAAMGGTSVEMLEHHYVSTHRTKAGKSQLNH